jgi:hypothetical protein
MAWWNLYGSRESTILSRCGRLLVVVCTVSLMEPRDGSARSSVVLLTEGLQAREIQRQGQLDFDFEIGSWTTRLSRLVRPLTGSTTWVHYEGTTVVRKIWNGRANLVELNVEGAAGHIEGLSLRLYNPQTRQWSLHFSNSNDGALAPPVTGEFKNARGEFYGMDTLDGRPVLVRFVITDITRDSCRFEQAFSGDGGKTWEVNWIATDTRAPAIDKGDR